MLHHRRLVPVASAAVVFLSLSALGCADLTLAEFGEEYVDPFELERSYALAAAPLTECPRGRMALEPGDDADAASVDFSPVAGACLVDIRVTGAVLLSRREVDDYAAQLESRGNIGALRGIDLELRELGVDDGDGEPVDLSVHSLSVAVEREVVLGEDDIDAMREGASPRITMPQPLLDRFVAVLQDGGELRTDLRLRLLLRNPGRNVPNELSLRALLQPIALVDVLAAI